MNSLEKLESAYVRLEKLLNALDLIANTACDDASELKQVAKDALYEDQNTDP